SVLGIGNTRMVMYFEMIAILLYLLYSFIVIEQWRLPLAYAWASEFVYWFSLLSMCAYYLLSGRWKHYIARTRTLV
ncbi:MAG TPA: hypothetical protein PKC41_10965, partial [Chitinophagaceae bacterium]|nr:hypothetical protein [Chitinophagaceae bacterium]